MLSYSARGYLPEIERVEFYLGMKLYSFYLGKQIKCKKKFLIPGRVHQEMRFNLGYMETKSKQRLKQNLHH